MLEVTNSSSVLAWGSAEILAGRGISGLGGPPLQCPDIFASNRGHSGLQTGLAFERDAVAVTDGLA